jgi:hypothetical protein
MNRHPKTALAAMAAALALTPAFARADLLTFSAAGKALTTGGTGHVADVWDGAFGYGVEAGIEVLGIDVLGEAYMFSPDQYQFSGNLGFDLDFGETVRITPGLFAGAIVYYLPEPTNPSGLDVDTLPADVKAQIGADNLAKIDAKYQDFAEDEAMANRTLTALTGRARLTLEYAILPILFIGAEGDVGLHYLVSGADATTKAKRDLIASQKAENPAAAEAYDALGDAIGANDSTEIDRTGLNFSAGVFLKAEL